jgi:hypothetical protein
MVYSGSNEHELFGGGSLREWLASRRQRALQLAHKVDPELVLNAPPEQLAEEIIADYSTGQPKLDLDGVRQDISDQEIDVSGDPMRAIAWDHRPLLIPGSRLTFFVPYSGPEEVLRLVPRARTTASIKGRVLHGEIAVSVTIPADQVKANGGKAADHLHGQLDLIATHLARASQEIDSSNDELKVSVLRAVETRRRKVLADRNLQAAIGVPLRRDETIARSYVVEPVTRKARSRLRIDRGPASSPPFKPEPRMSNERFEQVVEDIGSMTRSFERLSITHADLREERLRDQILAMLSASYHSATGETFSKRGKTDIYLPFEDGGAVFLAECKWWEGGKKFSELALPQLLDNYVVWRDTHAAMILFIKNKDASSVIAKAEEAVRAHTRFLREDDPVAGHSVFVLHRDGDTDREIRLALITAVIHP